MQNKVIRVDVFLRVLKQKEEGIRKRIAELPSEKELLKRVAKGYGSKTLAAVAIKETMDILQQKSQLDGQLKAITEITKGIEASIAPAPSATLKEPAMDADNLDYMAKE